MGADTVHIVSGFMRCGTSMMMRALERGGLDARYNKTRDHLNRKFGDDHYQPNPGGFYELSREQYRVRGFPRKWKGCLIKALHGAMWRLVAGHYRIVFMRRDPEEIRQSYEAFFNKAPPPVIENYTEVMDDVVSMLEERRDVDLLEFNYRDVVNNPLVNFKLMKDCRWPIDPEKAASVVDPGQCRFKIENLEIGI